MRILYLQTKTYARSTARANNIIKEEEGKKWQQIVCGFESRRSSENKTLTAAWQTPATTTKKMKDREKNSSMVENARLYHHNALKIALLFAFYVSIMRFRCVALSSSMFMSIPFFHLSPLHNIFNSFSLRLYSFVSIYLCAKRRAELWCAILIHHKTANGIQCNWII